MFTIEWYIFHYNSYAHGKSYNSNTLETTTIAYRHICALLCIHVSTERYNICAILWLYWIEEFLPFDLIIDLRPSELLYSFVMMVRRRKWILWIVAKHIFTVRHLYSLLVDLFISLQFMCIRWVLQFTHITLYVGSEDCLEVALVVWGHYLRTADDIALPHEEAAIQGHCNNPITVRELYDMINRDDGPPQTDGVPQVVIMTQLTSAASGSSPLSTFHNAHFIDW